MSKQITDGQLSVAAKAKVTGIHRADDDTIRVTFDLIEAGGDPAVGDGSFTEDIGRAEKVAEWVRTGNKIAIGFTCPADVCSEGCEGRKYYRGIKNVELLYY